MLPNCLTSRHCPCFSPAFNKSNAIAFALTIIGLGGLSFGVASFYKIGALKNFLKEHAIISLGVSGGLVGVAIGIFALNCFKSSKSKTVRVLKINHPTHDQGSAGISRTGTPSPDQKREQAAPIMPEQVREPISVAKPEQVQCLGREQWKKYYNVDVGDEPALPNDIATILDEQIPAFEGYNLDKKIHNTFVLILVPIAVDGKDLTLPTLTGLLEKPVSQTHKISINNELPTSHKDKNPGKSYWMLFDRSGRVAPLCWGAAKQGNYLNRYPRFTRATALETVIAISMMFCGNEILFDDQCVNCMQEGPIHL